MAGIYIHIPFCLSKCSYCDFASFVCLDNNIIDKYIGKLTKEIKEEAETYCKLGGKPIAETIYIGGGTPSLLNEKQIYSIVGAIKDSFEIADDCEFSIESNPDTITNELPKIWKTVGINRVSLGLQSADNEILKSIGRRHSFEGFLNAVNCVRGAGLSNINVDIMLGLPNQSLNIFKDTLNKLFLSNIQFTHVSAYGLKVEKGTKIYPYEPPSDLCADMYEYAVDFLKSKNLQRYEISNFSTSNSECRHNLKYWDCEDYLGIGLASHGYYNRIRTVNSSNLDRYLNNEAKKTRRISKGELAKDFIMLQLRKSCGINVKKYNKISGSDFFKRYESVLDSLEKKGLISINSDAVKINPRFFYISNRIILEFL